MKYKKNYADLQLYHQSPKIYFVPKNSSKNNFAYIDGTNLHKGITDLGWELNYKRFRVWLSEKYGIRAAYIFIGLVPIELAEKEKAPDENKIS